MNRGSRFPLEELCFYGGSNVNSSTFGLKDSPDKQARNSELLRPPIQEVESERCQEAQQSFWYASREACRCAYRRGEVREGFLRFHLKNPFKQLCTFAGF